MDSQSQPLVSIVTPVYNNAEHIAECIESVLAQTYRNWEYTIVNNCSTDGSGEVARRYAAKYPRIRVRDNDRFLRSVASHNQTLRQISVQSKYCKIVFADDWIYPQCVEEMVALAEAHPSIGIVGAYGLEESRIAWAGLPYFETVISGREICRRMFLAGLYVFGTSNSVLYRSDLVRSRDPFYNEANFQADRDACVALLKNCDFGFVHQVLSFKRLAPGSLTLAVGWDLMTHFATLLRTLVDHGHDYLDDSEYDLCRERLLREYYNFLAVSFLRGRHDKKFWDYQKAKLNETVGFSGIRLARSVLARIVRLILNPYEAFGKLMRGKAWRPQQMNAGEANPFAPRRGRAL